MRLSATVYATTGTTHNFNKLIVCFAFLNFFKKFLCIFKTADNSNLNVHIADFVNSFFNTFRWLRRADYEILCITISSKLSGTYNNAVQAARRMQGHHIQVVDSLCACSGLYLLIREASRMIGEGSGLSSTARQILRLRERVRTCFSVDDLAPLRRGGRLGAVRTGVSAMLNIKPILELRDGAVVHTGISRGKIDQCNKLVAFCEGASGRIAVESFLGDDAAARLSIKLAREDREVERRRVGPVLGAHLGRGCVGVTYIEPLKQ